MLFSFGKRTLGLLEEGQSYQLINFSITEYENVKYTTMCWEGSEVNHIEELEGVVTSVDPLVMEAECTILNEPNIAVVFKIDTFFKCLQCGSRTEPVDGNETRCFNKECGILKTPHFVRTLSRQKFLLWMENAGFVSLHSVKW